MYVFISFVIIDKYLPKKAKILGLFGNSVLSFDIFSWQTFSDQYFKTAWGVGYLHACFWKQYDKLLQNSTLLC